MGDLEALHLFGSLYSLATSTHSRRDDWGTRGFRQPSDEGTKARARRCTLRLEYNIPKGTERHGRSVSVICIGYGKEVKIMLALRRKVLALWVVF